MKKLKLSVAALLIAGASFAQTNKSVQCTALTKKNVQCKNTTRQGTLCYLHNPNYVKKNNNTKAVVCNGTTKAGNNCKNKTKDASKLCHLHRKN
tara:strand:+ start:45 stop:326 length:282 start_codon:yes stop_codon:yes gene_type:complete